MTLLQDSNRVRKNDGHENLPEEFPFQKHILLCTYNKKQ